MLSIIARFRFFAIFITIAYSVTSYAYDLTLTKRDGGFQLVGKLDSSDSLYNPSIALSNGLIIYYHDPNSEEPAIAYSVRKCMASQSYSIEVINDVLSASPFLSRGRGNFNKKDGSVEIRCKWQGSVDRAWAFISRPNLPVEDEKASCNLSTPALVDFGSVKIGDRIQKGILASLSCNKNASVRVSLKGTGQSGILNMGGTIVRYGLLNGKESGIYQVNSGQQLPVPISFNLTDTGTIAGMKQGYILVISEVM